jgi:uncharacterized iron-regulated protein
MSTQKTLIEIQKESFSELLDEINERRMHESSRITKYRRIYLDEVENYTAISSKSELFDDLQDTQVIYCGDFHTLHRSQYTAIKILKHLASTGRKIFLGLELVPMHAQDIANDYVDGRISEDTFLSKIDYEKVWGFPWEYYKPLFDLAKKHNMHILGLNSADEAFKIRDQVAAGQIIDCLENNPDARVFCLYGDLHIATKHIPSEVEKLRKKRKLKKIKTTSIFQNCDEIYWKLLDENLAHQVDVVKISTNSYCIISSTPWIKWQSYQSWLDEHVSLIEGEDEEDFGYHQSPDFFHDIHRFADDIQDFLHVKIRSMDEYEVFTPFDTKVIEKIYQYFQSMEEAPKKSVQKIMETELIENRSILIPNESVIYLLDFSQNRAAEKASQLVAAKLSDELCIYEKNFDEKEIFYRLLLWEAIGFFGSKIINPKRKCDQYKDLKNRLEEYKGKKTKGKKHDDKVVAQQVLQHREFEISRLDSTQATAPRKIYQLRPKLFLACTRTLGRIMGDQLYSKVIDESVSLKVVQRLFTCLSTHNQAKKVYWELVWQIKTHEPHEGPSKDELF